jgi:hypothetical protein
MNERFNEIRREIDITKLVPKVKDPNDYKEIDALFKRPVPNTVIESFMEEFARLVVQECCELLKNSGDDWEKFAKNPPAGQENNASAALFAAYRLKEDAVGMLEDHFGINE